MAVAGQLQAATAEAPLVKLHDVFKIYREGSTETVALRGTSLELRRGSITSLVGPSGSGKSTLLALIAGLSLPSAGQVMVRGEDIGRLDESARAQMRAEAIGLVFQSGNLIPFLTAEENVRMALRLAGPVRNPGARARQLLNEVGLGSRLRHRPSQLSGGELQRTAVAVALANDPELLLADELTGELDSATAEQVMSVVTNAWQQRSLTVLLVTHNGALAERAQHRLRLVDGLVDPA